MSSVLNGPVPDLPCELVLPGDADYASASRTVLNTGSPAAILRPSDATEVQDAIRYAGGLALPVSVRGGGHSFAGFGTNDGGVVIDLHRLDSVEVIDAERHVVRIGGGATWGQVVAALGPQGLAISSGDNKGVGVGGLTLTGGIGWKVRKYGLALDSLIGAEVVTAQGDLLHASDDENPDLFWALRGGGGNAGIVTSFEFVAHPSTDLVFGTISFPANEIGSVLPGWADHLRAAPEDLTSNAVFANPFLGGPQAPLQVTVAFDGDDVDLANAAIDPIRRLGTVLDDDIALRPYSDTLEDARVPPPGVGFLVRNGFVHPESVADALAILTRIGATEGSPIIALRSLGAAVSRVPDDATAYAHRSAELMVLTTFAGPQPALEAAAPAMDRIWAELGPHTRGAYGNFLSTATRADVSEVYPPATRARLATVKSRHDPDNVFTGNHNVPPLRPGNSRDLH